MLTAVGLLVLCSCAADHSRPETATLPIHSHNDYEHSEPLWAALRSRARSIEIDVFPGEGTLLVAHDRDEVRADRTIDTMYLDPLRQRMETLGGVYPHQPDEQPIILLIDFKAEPERCLALLVERTRPLKRFLARRDENGVFRGAIVICVSGVVPRDSIRSLPSRDIFIDGRLADLDSEPCDSMPLISSRWSDTFAWNGTGPIPPAELERLRAIVRAAHDHDAMVRFWAAPYIPAAWDTLLSAGVDLINTDRPNELADHLDPPSSRAE
ncbi:MAG: hypothetical protein AAFO89_06035 [Planctomycetota bacterium]